MASQLRQHGHLEVREQPIFDLDLALVRSVQQLAHLVPPRPSIHGCGETALGKTALTIWHPGSGDDTSMVTLDAPVVTCSGATAQAT
jgi:hypothetical protein